MRVDLVGSQRRFASDPFGNSFGMGHVLRGLAAVEGDGDDSVNTGGGGSSNENGRSPTCYSYGSTGECLSYTTDGGSTINSCSDNSGNILSGVAACQGIGPNGGAGGSYQAPADGETVTNCSAYDQYGNCVTCGAGFKLNTWGGDYTSCDSVGGLPGAKKPTQASGFQSILNSFSNLFKPSAPISAATAAACAAAGGQWTGTQCAPKSSFVIGGTAISMTTLLVIGVAAVFLLKKK